MEAVVKLFVKAFEFMHKIANVAFAKIELRNTIKVFVAPRYW
jgi:hypothetical protein